MKNCFYVYFAVLFVVAHAGVTKNSIEVSANTDAPWTQPIVLRLGPPKWKGSCVFIEQIEKATFEEAKIECEKKNGILWTPKSEGHIRDIMRMTEPLSFTWTGLSKKNEAEPKWQSETQFDHKKIDWLVEPFSASSNGFSSVSQCVAFYNGYIRSTKYNYFYPCESKFRYVCEKHSGFIPR